MASNSTYFVVGLIIPLCLILPIYFWSLIVVLTLRPRKTPEGSAYRLPHVYQLLLKAMFVGLELKGKNVSKDCAQCTCTCIDSQAQEPQANVHAADSENQTSTETAIDFEENNSDDQAILPQYFELFLHGKKLRSVAVYSIVALTGIVLSTTVATLWTTLLIRKGITCGEAGFDCFAGGEPVTDCSMFENGTIVYINGTHYNLECYRFVVDYVGGFSAAGGFTFFAKIVVNLLLLAVISMSKIKSRICHTLLMALFSLLPITAMCFPLFLLQVFGPLLHNIFVQYIYCFSFVFCIIACLLLAWSA